MGADAPTLSSQAAGAASFRQSTARLSWLSSALQIASGESGSSMSGKSPRPSRFVPCHVKYAATGSWYDSGRFQLRVTTSNPPTARSVLDQGLQRGFKSSARNQHYLQLWRLAA